MSASPDRIASLDIARGGTILLVIVWHSYLAAKTIGPVGPMIQSVNETLQTVRMPLFFFCSGLLAFWGLSRSWNEILTGRVWTMVWIYVVWSTLTLGLDQLYPTTPWQDETQQLGGFLWLSYGSQWFIYALVCATLFARAVFYLPLAAQIGLVLAAQVALHVWSPKLIGFTTNFDYLVTTMASYGLLFFMSGIWLARLAVPMMSDRRIAWRAFLVGFAGWFAIMALEKTVAPGIPQAVMAAPGVVAGLALASILAIFPLVRDPMQWVGQRTLEIFVCHQFVVGLVTLACISTGTAPSLAFLVIAALTCGGAVAFAWATTSGGPRFLFRPPKVMARRLRPAAI